MKCESPHAIGGDLLLIYRIDVQVKNLVMGFMAGLGPTTALSSSGRGPSGRVCSPRRTSALLDRSTCHLLLLAVFVLRKYLNYCLRHSGGICKLAVVTVLGTLSLVQIV